MFDIVATVASINMVMHKGQMTPQQEDGYAVLFDAFIRHKWSSLRWMAYLLATVYHETARTMQPIDEKGGQKYFFRMYDRNGNNPQLAKRLGNIYPGDGDKYHGRGAVQITGRHNYATFANLLKIDLVEHPQLAKIPNVSADIACIGMEKGLFTGVGLSRYFDHDTTDWVGARKIINPDKNGELIADYAERYFRILKYQKEAAKEDSA